VTEPPVNKAVVVPSNDPVYSVYVWRQDSITLARLRPVLAELDAIDNQPCAFGDGCPVSGMTCMPCAVRRIKTQLFGPPEGEASA